MRFRTRAVFVLLVVGLSLGGCGFGPGPGTGAVSLTVTRGFGGHRIAALIAAHVPGSETVMRLLERSFRVQTRYGGGFVQSIDAGSGHPGRTDWFYYVNGVQAPQGAATTAVHRGDRIWWDLHDWQVTNSVPAVVGSFPAPFVNGVKGKRYPTTLACAGDLGAACQRVAAALTAIHVPVASQLLGTGSGPDTLGIVVGTWSEVRPQLAARLIAHGPSASGVYVRFTDPTALQILDPKGHVARTLGAGAGLVAATADNGSVPTWLITGTDAAGVMAAARALNERALRDHFALAVQGSSQLPVPLQGDR